MLINDVDENPDNYFNEECDECSEPKREVLLEPDEAVSGALAFRLTGNRTRGVFISYVNQKSKQSETLRQGDQILEVNGINVRRLTCDQIASILRVAVNDNGYALLQIGPRQQSKFAKNVLYEVSRDENSNLRYCYTIYNVPRIHDSTLPTSSSDTTALSESALHTQASKTCTLHYNKGLPAREYIQLVCFDQINEHQFSFTKQRKLKQLQGQICCDHHLAVSLKLTR